MEVNLRLKSSKIGSDDSIVARASDNHTDALEGPGYTLLTLSHPYLRCHQVGSPVVQSTNDLEDLGFAVVSRRHIPRKRLGNALHRGEMDRCRGV